MPGGLHCRQPVLRSQHAHRPLVPGGGAAAGRAHHHHGGRRALLLGHQGREPARHGQDHRLLRRRHRAAPPARRAPHATPPRPRTRLGRAMGRRAPDHQRGRRHRRASHPGPARPLHHQGPLRPATRRADHRLHRRPAQRPHGPLADQAAGHRRRPRAPGLHRARDAWLCPPSTSSSRARAASRSARPKTCSPRSAGWMCSTSRACRRSALSASISRTSPRPRSAAAIEHLDDGDTDGPAPGGRDPGRPRIREGERELHHRRDAHAPRQARHDPHAPAAPRKRDPGRQSTRTQRAYYFRQVQNGMYIRMALMAAVLGRLG